MVIRPYIRAEKWDGVLVGGARARMNLEKGWLYDRGSIQDPPAQADPLEAASILQAGPFQGGLQAHYITRPPGGHNTCSKRLNAFQAFDVGLVRGVPDTTAVVQMDTIIMHD